MSRNMIQKIAALAALFFLSWVGAKYILPLTLPFLFGAALALAAEPVVSFASEKLHLPRFAGALLGVSGAIALLAGLVILAGSLAIRELGSIARTVPDLEQTFRQGFTLLEDFLVSLADRAPDGLRSLLTRLVLGLFSGGSALVDRIAGQVTSLLSRMISHVPEVLLVLGTGLLSAFMISARLPKLKAWLRGHVPQVWKQQYLPALKQLRLALGGWLKAQIKLMGVTYLIVTAGLLAFRVPHAPLWAAGIALVDALPLLGTGTILIPWCVISLLQGDTVLALGLAAIYAAAALTRSALEPRLVGKQLGLDPLVTLIALYAGFQIWGLPGMLLAPLLSAAAMQLSGMETG